MKQSPGKWQGIGAMLLMLSASTTLYAESEPVPTLSPNVTEDGSIRFPQDFQTRMVHLGSWFVADGDASGFHDVYTETESLEAYRKNGKFPDGATLVKLLRESKTGKYTTGNQVSHATTGVKQWFVMVKDSSGRFVKRPEWGDGWGWALFKPGQTQKNAVTNYKTDCLGCHVPARDKDWLYTEAYPVLKEK